MKEASILSHRVKALPESIKYLTDPEIPESMKITFIQTGGTIDKDYPRKTGGYAFEIMGPAVKRVIESIGPTIEYEIIPLLQKDSLDLNDKDRELIVLTCTRSENQGIIITHGTDSMIETSRFLLSDPGLTKKTIFLTGATKPERFKGSDAHFNIGSAIGAIELTGSGVYIAMNGLVIPAEKAVRDIDTGKFRKNEAKE